MNTLIWLTLGSALAVIAKDLERLSIPVVIVSIITGMLLGPLWLGLMSFGEAERVVAEIAVVLILFSAGYEIRWSGFLGCVRAGIIVGMAGIVFSVALGFFAVISIVGRVDEALYIGVALAATSIGISVPLLAREGILDTTVGQVLLAAAIVDDVLALYLLSSVHIALTDGHAYGEIAWSLLTGLLTLVGLTLLIRILAAWTLPTVLLHNDAGRRVAISLSVLLAAWITHQTGLSGAVGGFFAGAALSTVKYETYSYDQAFFSKLASWAAPLFFLAIGMQITDLGPVDKELIWLVLTVMLAAILGKMVAPLFIASQLHRKERWILGLALLPRGEVGLIVASIGLSQQHISHHGMVALMIMTLMTALLPALLLPKLRA